MFHRANCDAGLKEEPVTCPIPQQLTDEQWLLICDLFPIPKPDPRGGRPRVDNMWQAGGLFRMQNQV